MERAVERDNERRGRDREFALFSVLFANLVVHTESERSRNYPQIVH